jgi:hypothetical protein
MAKGGEMPKRVIAGQSTKLSRSMHDIRYDEVHDEYFVTSPFAQAVLAYAGSIDGDQAPVRAIQGPHTQLGSDRLDVDAVHNELFVPVGNAILVFPRDANGDVAPIRVIRGKDTQLQHASSVVVDPINNVLIVGLNIDSTSVREGKEFEGAILIFNRTDNGNVKPRGVIKGPKSGIFRINQMAAIPSRRFSSPPSRELPIKWSRKGLTWAFGALRTRETFRPGGRSMPGRKVH